MIFSELLILLVLPFSEVAELKLKEIDSAFAKVSEIREREYIHTHSPPMSTLFVCLNYRLILLNFLPVYIWLEKRKIQKILFFCFNESQSVILHWFKLSLLNNFFLPFLLLLIWHGSYKWFKIYKLVSYLDTCTHLNTLNTSANDHLTSN